MSGDRTRVQDLPTFNTHEQVWHQGRVPAWFTRHALRIARFVDETPPPVLDLGERNPKIEIIAGEKGFTFASLADVDFDYDPISGQWGTIFCLEILEHLYNPLFALENMKRALAPGGVIYLSTPGRRKMFWPDQHFHEIDDKRIAWLFRRAGLAIERREQVPIRREWWWHLTGIRPLLRIFNGTRVYKLRASGDRRGATD